MCIIVHYCAFSAPYLALFIYLFIIKAYTKYTTKRKNIKKQLQLGNYALINALPLSLAVLYQTCI